MQVYIVHAEHHMPMYTICWACERSGDAVCISFSGGTCRRSVWRPGPAHARTASMSGVTPHGPRASTSTARAECLTEPSAKFPAESPAGVLHETPNESPPECLAKSPAGVPAEVPASSAETRGASAAATAEKSWVDSAPPAMWNLAKSPSERLGSSARWAAACPPENELKCKSS